MGWVRQVHHTPSRQHRPQRLLALLLALAAASIVLAFPPTARAGATAAPIPAAEFERMVTMGHADYLRGAVIEGDVDLRRHERIARPVRCLACMFLGSVFATDVVFGRVVDLSSSHVVGYVDLQGATFEGPFLLRGARLKSDVVADLARFEQAAAFDGTRFTGRAYFRSVQFASEASFVDADFVDAADFSRSSFAGPAVFYGSLIPGQEGVALGGVTCDGRRGRFMSDAIFFSTTFRGAADFRIRCFGDRGSSYRGAAFLDTTFGAQADFSSSLFVGRALFSGASFQDRALFLGTRFLNDALYVGASTSDRIDFDGSLFARGVTFARLTASGTVVLNDIGLGEGTRLGLRDVRVSDLEMSVGAIANVDGPDVKENVLVLIEESAKRRGDIEQANDALFERRSLENERMGPVKRFFDGVLHRDLAGYLVRPLRPLLAFLVLVGIAATLRALAAAPRPAWAWLSDRGRALRMRLAAGATPRGRGSVHRRARASLSKDNIRGVSRRAHRGLVWLGRAVTALLSGVARALEAALRKTPGIEVKDHDQLRHLLLAGVQLGEWVGYKALMAAFVIALANANSTLRDIVQSVF